MSTTHAVQEPVGTLGQLTLIHDFELRWDGHPVAMSPSAQRLVSYVALHEHPVRRSKVSGALWLEAAEERASASLRSALWRVPSPDGVALLATSPSHVWLNPMVEVDLRSAMARAYRLLDMAATDVSVVAIARELCSFRDSLLPGWYDDWVVMERERFHHLRLQTLDRLGEQLRLENRLADAIQVGLAAIQAEPLHETAHRLIIQVHLTQGNIGEALHQYRSYRKLLSDEVGATPSAELRRLVEGYVIPRPQAS